tara:strand:+ start:22711 stop:25935 length:3225 start_codon:yes stop_codon:yes gene_type:complete
MKFVYKYYFLFLVGLTFFKLDAQQLRFTSLTIEDGLSQSMVKQIYKDKFGYIWIATQDGLNKYNGYEFNVYRNNIYDSTTISDNNISAIAETANGKLYIGTQNGGLNLYDPFTGKFSSILINNDSAYHNVKALIKDNKSNLWLIAENYLFSYSPDKNTWKDISGKFPKSVRFTCLYFKDDVLWIGSDKGIFSYNVISQKVKQYLEKTKGGEPKFQFVVKDIFIDENAGLWYATTGMGLCKIDLKNNNYHYLLFEKQLSNFVHDVTQDEENRLWIASSKGLGIIENNKLKKYTAKAEEHGLLSNRVNCVLPDETGYVWIGTDAGINIYKKYLFKFEHIYKPSNVRRSSKYPSGNTIMCFEQLNDSIMVVGNLDYGLDFWHLNNNTFTNYPTFQNKLHYRILALLNDKQNNRIWIGSWGGGFNYYDTENKTFAPAFDADKQINGTRLCNNTVLDFEKGPKNTLWIGTYNGLSVFNIDEQKFQNYFTVDGLPNNTVNYLKYDDNRNRMWLGTAKGLAYYDFDDEKIHSFKLQNPKLLQGKSINTILTDNDVIWVGTSQGLIKYNFKTQAEKGYFLPDGLPNEYIYGILKDAQNHLWISTNNGLSRFDITNEKFKNYTEKDGLQSNEFNQGAYFKSANGTMYFGGINGFNAFNPQQIMDNPILPKIYITKIIASKGVFKTDTALTFKNHISLKYKDAKSLTIEFEALEYTLPQENLYQWKLEGFDDEWSEPVKRRFAIYSNLSGGEYIFKVRAANHDGVWNNTPATIKITIIPPFYQTASFYIGCIIAGILLVLLIIRLRTRRIIAEKNKLEEKVQERTKELNEKNKDILSSIEYAKRIQEAILPPMEKIRKAFPNSFVIYLPKDIVSGDFYWFAETKDNFFIAAVDCTGHGVPGAFMSMIGSSLLNQIVQIQKVENTGEILNRLNERVVSALNQQGHKYDTRDGMDLALIRKSKHDDTIEYSGAYRPLYVIRENGLFEKFDADKRPIGGSVDAEFSFHSHLIQINTGDTVYMFSDGFPDQFGGPKNKKFMVKNFRKLLLSVYQLPVEKQKEQILNTFKEWKGDNEQVDDILVIGIKF